MTQAIYDDGHAKYNVTIVGFAYNGFNGINVDNKYDALYIDKNGHIVSDNSEKFTVVNVELMERHD